MATKKPVSGAVALDPESEVAGEVIARADDAHPGAPMPLPVPAGGWPADEFTGKGGHYVRDPFTGKRRPAEPATTQEAGFPALDQ